MFSHLLNLRERQHPERQPHRLAATGPAGAGSALSPRGLHVPSRVGSGASVISPRSQKPVHGNDWQCADAQPAFRTLNRQAGRRARLPSVRPTVDHPAAMYTNLEGLQRMGEPSEHAARQAVRKHVSG